MSDVSRVAVSLHALCW